MAARTAGPIVSGRLSPSCSANQRPIAPSYAPVRAKAAAARRRRTSIDVQPSWASRSASSASYWSGSVTMATQRWFFAAERTMEGPPMSICSITSAKETPGVFTVASKG